jgi:hypothetical protein
MGQLFLLQPSRARRVPLQVVLSVTISTALDANLAGLGFLQAVVKDGAIGALAPESSQVFALA